MDEAQGVKVPRALSVRLPGVESEEVRSIAAQTGRKVGEVLELLLLGCLNAIRTGALKKKLVEREVERLQGLLFERQYQPQGLLGLPPLPPGDPGPEPRIMFDGPPEPEVPWVDPRTVRREY